MLSSKQPLETPLRDDRADELHRLERLWEAPAVSEPGLERRGRASALLELALDRLGWLLAASWVAFLATVLLLAPASQETSAGTPVWVEALVAGLWLSLPLATIGGLARSAWVGYGASLAASAMAVALSIGCSTTGHHTGSWWLYELGGSVALTGIAAAGLCRARRPARSTGS
jgi:hypothetical protein